MQDIVSTIQYIKKLEYKYLYKKEPFTDCLYEIILKILLADMKNLSIFQGNGLQFMFLLVERAIFYADLFYEESFREFDKTANGESIIPDDLVELYMYYQNKRFDIDSISFFNKKILEFDDEESSIFISGIELIINFNGNIETLSSNIYKILESKDDDYEKSYNLYNLMKTM